jgi:hypothetical protein
LTASEFAFLALGLVLGVASGAALVEVVRSRPPAPREVRVTVAPNSVPRRRSTTLAEDAFETMPQEPARGGPADRRSLDRDPDVVGGTPVRSRALPPAGAGDPTPGAAFSPTVAFAAAGAGSPALAVAAPRYGAMGPTSGARSSLVGVRVHDETDWTLEALRLAAARTAEQAHTAQRLTSAAVLDRRASEVGPARELGSAVPVAQPRATSNPGESMDSDTNAHAGTQDAVGDPGTTAAAAATDDTCGDARRVADERCTLATRAREQAATAHDALRAAQRAYDDHHTRSEQAMVVADPRAMRAAKETAQHAFRHARSSAGTPDEVEAAARDWLTEINRINHASRDAAAEVQRERAAANGLVMTIERLSVEADAARISAEAADAACTAARQAVADCQEAAEPAPRAAAFPPVPSAGMGTSFRPADGSEATELEAAFEATGSGEPVILRLLRGDRATMTSLVSELAGDDESERRRWQRSIGDLVDAIVGRAIEASVLTFPLEHAFWGSFTLGQNRDIVAALSSLGYRFDGFGGWSDERVPGQRDLSLAVGYAGLDPMRLRRWPNEAEMGELFADVAVAADEYLAETAGGLTLGELVDVLGRRADALTELWNDWGRVRPLLLAGG